MSNGSDPMSFLFFIFIIIICYFYYYYYYFLFYFFLSCDYFILFLIFLWMRRPSGDKYSFKFNQNIPVHTHVYSILPFIYYDRLSKVTWLQIWISVELIRFQQTAASPPGGTWGTLPKYLALNKSHVTNQVTWGLAPPMVSLSATD